MEVEIVTGFNPDDILPVSLARERGIITRGIRSCTACDLVCGMPVSPVPFSGPLHPLFVAVGEGPGSDESRVGRPFVGKSGKLLRAMLGQVGILGSEVEFANVVSCWPKAANGKDTRAPSDKEAAACRDNLKAQVLLSLKSPFVLLVGGTALRSVRPDMKVSRDRGRVLLWHLDVDGEIIQTFYCMSILHPAAILRQRAFKDPTIEDLRRWADIVKGEANPLNALGVSRFGEPTCIICEDYMSHLDADGIPYCGKHWLRHGEDWKRAREFWQGAVGGVKGKGERVKVRGRNVQVSDDQQTIL